ncbi:MAG TPA: hypothetical protein VGQ76_18280 [Thermoanaerobaculia bacterium]|jgi:hypothetical protein|nr:hypothetical protein [Thermoanaerobaculia bacterium]
MQRKVVIVAALLFATLLSTKSYAGGYQRWNIYYSDATFTTPVGKKFFPSNEGCDPPYDDVQLTGTQTVYHYSQSRDVCGTQGGSVFCWVNLTAVSCPSGLDWVDDWWSLGLDW